MGCDGGTIPRRDELVRLKKKPEQVNNWSKACFASHLSHSIPLSLPERQRCREAVPVETLQSDPGTATAANRNVRPGSAVLQAERHRAPAGEQNARIVCAHQIPQGHQGSESDGQSGVRGSSG